MEIFRIAQDTFAEDLSGNGARLFGGRWNSEGRPAVYAGSTRALALLETLAHTPPSILSNRVFRLITIEIPDTIVGQTIPVSRLPADWNSAVDRSYTQSLGDEFLETKQHLFAVVPSVVVFEENNILLNPLHPDAAKIRITHSRRILFDRRITTAR